MTYQELIAKALNGRSVNKAAQDWGIPQPTMDRYAKGKTIPDYQTTLLIARDAGVGVETVVKIFATQEALKKPRGMFAEIGYAIGALFISVNLFLTPSPAEAAPALKLPDVNFALCKMKAILRRAANAFLAWLLPPATR